jgi:hypothetical protein
MTRSGRARLAIAATAVTVVLATAAPAAASATATPGALSTADLPAGYAQPGSAQTFTTFSLPTTDAATCRETPAAVPGLAGATLVTFSPPNAPTTTAGLSESILWFANAKAAKAVYAARVANDQARWKCGAVGFVPPGQSAPIATINYTQAKVPKIGSGSFATSGTTGTSPTGAPVTATFVSGPYLVLVGFAAPPNAPNPADEKAILKAAQRRLTKGAS